MKKHSDILVIRICLATLSFAAFIIAFTGIAPACLAIARTQLAPRLLQCIAAATFGSILSMVLLLLSALVLGRAYCSIVCPLGLMQDCIGLVSRKFSHQPKNLPCVRFAIAGFVFAALGFGFRAIVRTIDPYANAGRIFASFLSGGFISLAAIIVLALLFRRAFCSTVCPVGTLLGLVSKSAFLKLRIDDGCAHCGLCARHCPTNAINVNSSSIDNEICVRCMECTSACPRGLIKFGISRGKDASVKVDKSRRELIANGVMLAAGAVLGRLAAKSGLSAKSEHFGVATFDPTSCIVFQDDAQCGRCARACPSSAIELRANGTPKQPKPALCIGCGACQAACPARPKAMRVIFKKND